jgi:hypothetical protein
MKLCINSWFLCNKSLKCFLFVQKVTWLYSDLRPGGQLISFWNESHCALPFKRLFKLPPNSQLSSAYRQIQQHFINRVNIVMLSFQFVPGISFDSAHKQFIRANILIPVHNRTMHIWLGMGKNIYSQFRISNDSTTTRIHETHIVCVHTHTIHLNFHSFPDWLRWGETSNIPTAKRGTIKCDYHNYNSDLFY